MLKIQLTPIQFSSASNTFVVFLVSNVFTVMYTEGVHIHRVLQLYLLVRVCRKCCLVSVPYKTTEYLMTTPLRFKFRLELGRVVVFDVRLTVG